MNDKPKDNPRVYNRTPVLTLATAVSILFALKVAYHVEDNNFKRLVPESVILDSTYKARLDSLNKDYQMRSDSLEKVYELRKEQER